ncbi:MAG: hypothetical protein U0271_38220 [Polyangiaceae bacterium]
MKRLFLALAPLFALGCDQPVTNDVPCELVVAHVESLGETNAPEGLPESSRLEVAHALSEARQAPRCEDLSPKERSCQLQAKSLAEAFACLPAPPADKAAVNVEETPEGLVGPTAAPPLPMRQPATDLALNPSE